LASRKSTGTRLRFEVFKRDNFTCQYCGRKTPQVVLELDHIHPVSAGGTNDIDNLTTSCWECNRGKADGLLGDRAPFTSTHENTVTMLEREMQIKEYNEVKRQQREREDADIDDLCAYWCDLAGGQARQYPQPSILRHWLRTFAAEDIKDAMEIAMQKAGDWRGPKYLSGILRNWAGDAKGGDEE
jgi:DNA replication protein DnaD